MPAGHRRFLGIVANQCRTLRRARWWHVIRLAQPEAARPSPDLLTRADLRRALLELGPRQREALLLHFYLDLPLEEIATGPRPHGGRRQVTNQPRPAAAATASCLRGGDP